MYYISHLSLPSPILPCSPASASHTRPVQWLPVEAPGDEWGGGPVIPSGLYYLLLSALHHVWMFYSLHSTTSKPMLLYPTLPVKAPGDEWRGGPVIPPGQRVPRLARHLPVAKHVPVRDWN